MDELDDRCDLSDLMPGDNAPKSHLKTAASHAQAALAHLQDAGAKPDDLADLADEFRRVHGNVKDDLAESGRKDDEPAADVSIESGRTRESLRERGGPTRRSHVRLEAVRSW